ncbi:uncharacterized protein [Argopecten irradians]|uniref:uncharacterized protein isoform X2 n=1 Tax=Argopecten irradians TaxID=31199 RepID=UPI0037188DDE
MKAIFVLLMVWSFLAGLHCCQCGSFLPKESFYYVNETSHFTCAFDEPYMFKNASHIYITFNNTEVDQSFITIVNETTVTFSKVMQKDDDGTYKCRFRTDLGDNDSLIGTAEVKVDDPLQPINDIECVWYNWKDRLNCTWDLPYRYKEYIQVTLTWRNGVTNICPNMENNTMCIWKKTDATLQAICWEFMLTVYNTRHRNDSVTETDWIPKIPKDNVKPSPVKSFHHAFTNESTCVLLTWEYDRYIGSSREKYFRIQYSPVTDPSQNHTVWTEKYNKTICGLTPYTKYQFTIAVHPDRNAVKGYWSNSVSQQFTTDQDVPGAAPEMVGYRQPTEFCMDKEGTLHNINTTIYWKSIPEEYRNGVITSYRVKVHEMSPGAMEITLYNTQHTDTNLKLGCNKIYNVSITAATIKGYSQHHSSLIINTTGISPPVVMVERNASLYNISWTLSEPSNSLENFTVVYCKQLGSQQDCSGELEKVDVSNVHHHTLSLKSDTLYLFGVSVVRAGVNSAATFQSCVYVFTATPNPPEFSVDDSIKDDSLRVVWDPIMCNNQQPYVRSFTIMWCPTDRKQENQCSGHSMSVEVSSTSKNEYIIRNLQKGTRYGVMMLSSSIAQTSRRSVMKYGIPTNDDLSAGGIAGITIGAVVVAIIVIAGVFTIYRCTRKGLAKITTPYDFEVPELEKYTPKTTGNPSVMIDSSPNRSTGSSRSTNNSELPLLSKDHVMEMNGHTNLGQNHSGNSNSSQTKRQISRDSGKGGSLSSEPDMPDRLQPVPEDDTTSYTRIPAGGGPIIGGSSNNEPNSVLHNTSPGFLKSNDEPEREPTSQVQVNPTDITVTFSGGEESAGYDDGYKSPSQLMYNGGGPAGTVEDSPAIPQDGLPVAKDSYPVTKDSLPVIKDTGEVILTPVVQSGNRHILSNGSGASVSPGSSGPLSYTMMDTSSSVAGQLGKDTCVVMPNEESDCSGDGYSTPHSVGMLTQENIPDHVSVPSVGTYNAHNTTVT